MIKRLRRASYLALRPALGLLAAATLSTGLNAQTESDKGKLGQLASGAILVDVIVVPGSAAGHARATIEIASPPAVLWAVMLDCTRALKYIERLKSCKITSLDPGGRWDIREHVVEWIWPLPKVRSVFRSEYRPFESFQFSRIDGDLKELSGQWRLEPIQNGKATRLHYDARIDPGVPVPGFVLRHSIEAELRKTLAGLRSEATTRE